MDQDGMLWCRGGVVVVVVWCGVVWCGDGVVWCGRLCDLVVDGYVVKHVRVSAMSWCRRT